MNPKRLEIITLNKFKNKKWKKNLRENVWKEQTLWIDGIVTVIAVESVQNALYDWEDYVAG